MALFKKTTKKQAAIKKAEVAADNKPTGIKTDSFDQHFIIKQPLITEKSLIGAENDQYAFLVDRNASKSEAKKQIEKIYGVNIIKTRSLQRKEKPISYRGKQGTKPRLKKVIVTIKKGQKIELTGNK